MQPLLTNAEWSHLIDALQCGIELRQADIRGLLPSDPKDDKSSEARERNEWKAQIARYRQLRRKLLAEERKSR